MSGNALYADVAVVGGGAAGLMAACTAAKKLGGGARVVIIEKENRVGRKLLATGNGRCNLSNKNANISHYNGTCVSIADSILKKYSSDRLVSYFGLLGLVCREDTVGRIYPYDNKSSAVLDVLRLNLQRGGVSEMCGECVVTIKPQGGGYELKTSSGTLVIAKCVILATGGAASPKLGGCVYSYDFAKTLGLDCVPIFPALAPVMVKGTYPKRMKGIRAECVASLLADGCTTKRERGEVQFNDGVLSGICIFQLSRGVNEFIALGSIDGKNVSTAHISLDLLPDYTYDETVRLLSARRKRMADLPIDKYFAGFFETRMAMCLLDESGLHKNIRFIGELTPYDIECIAHTLKEWKFTPNALSDINSAQVTAGGICANEVDRHLMCVKYPALYIVGEALDIDGECGGYNLHWAFASGITAGESAARFVESRRVPKHR